MYTPVAVQERLTLIWHPNAFMNISFDGLMDNTGYYFSKIHKLMKNDTSMIPLRLRSISQTETANLKKNNVTY